MGETILKVDNLSKRYRIGATEEGYKTLREAIVDGITAPARNFGKLRNLTHFKNGEETDVIWALNGVSFEVEEGEALGIIGRNGAGKTTLLKILSRITEPTGGTAEIYGRVSSLLEVGTGFHPELTGRENIFLNGAILGMRKKEIEEKFDDIVGFAEIEKYIDTPVKRYSTGMSVRLAFAVAAHLEPEILIVDEVLAVGDIAFQKKCLNKMGDVARGGRTVLFVSHNMSAIRNLCESAIWIDNGQIVQMGTADEVIRNYEESQLKHFDESSYMVERNPEDIKNKDFYFSRVEMLNAKGEHTNSFRYNDTLTLIVDFDGESLGGNYNVIFYIYNELGQFVSSGASAEFHGKYFSKKVRKIGIQIGPLILTKGRYRILLTVRTQGRPQDIWENTIAFVITECQPFASNWELLTPREGACVVDHSFYEIE